MKKLLVILLLLSTSGFAQSKDDPAKQPNVYKIDFSVMEVQGGKRSNVRNYSMFLSANSRSHSTRVGNRVPLPAKDGGITYMDVGLNLNCQIDGEKDGAIFIQFNLDLGSLITPEGAASDHLPVVRQIRQDGVALLPLGKPTVISSADDTNTTRTVVVEATATLVK